MRFFNPLLLSFFIALFFGSPAFALQIPSRMVLKTDFNIWEVNLNGRDILDNYKKEFFLDIPIRLLPEESPLANGFSEEKLVEGVNIGQLMSYLESKIAPDINREKEDVTISRNEEGDIVFDGKGYYGRELDLQKSAYAIKKALEKGLIFVHLPLIRENPTVTVMDDELKKLGIKELVMSGETDFRRSPSNRITNIKVGLSKFNGHIIPPETEFSFGKVLGPVDASTGYLPELVIKGDKTLPEYGGGLCQVSTTSYRGALTGGIPILDRRNHSYAVSYYTPYGLDATVYPPSVDMTFFNDTPASLLVQSFTDGHKAYYNYYGTKDNRKTYLLGPRFLNYKNPPEAKVEYSDKLTPGEEQVVGHEVQGFDTHWYRQVIYEDPEKKPLLDHIFSRYQARPDYVIVGKEKEEKSEN